MKIKRKAIIIPGFGKCGTTTLHKTLTQHSEINKPKIKETHYFTLPDKTIKENQQTYEKINPNQKQRIIDSSPSYILNNKTPEKIKNAFNTEPHIIILIRDPAKRTHSAYQYRQRYLKKNNYQKLINQVKGPDYKTIKETENKAIKKEKIKKFSEKEINRLRNYQIKEENKTLKKELKKIIPHKPIKPTFFQESCYSQHTPLWEEKFKHVKIILLEELIKKPEETLTTIQEWLSLPIENITLPHANPTTIPNKIGKPIITIAKKVLSIKTIKKLKPIKKILTKTKPKMTHEEYNKTRKILTKEYEYWAKKIPTTKKYWKY